MPATIKKKKTSKRRPKKAPDQLDERSFREIIASAGGDWATGNLSLDAEVWTEFLPMLRASRDLWRTNPYIAKWQEQLAANVYGEAGIMFRSKIMETEDRVVYSADEKWALIAHEKKINELIDYANKRDGGTRGHYLAMKLAERLERATPESIMRGTALIEVGSPDVYANQRVEAAWSDWQRAEYCDRRGVRDYNTLRCLRLWSAARDGGHFIRMIRGGTDLNKYGFTLQHVNTEWCDPFYYVSETESGTTIRMGIEYEQDEWGIGKPVAYHFAKRQPRDWQHGGRYVGGYSGERTRIKASEIIHYARYTDTDSTRPQPWAMSSIGNVRQLANYEVAEVVAARMQACVTTWLYADNLAEGGVAGIPVDPVTLARQIRVAPGGMYGLPQGVKVDVKAPTHPNGNFGNYRKSMGQSIAAGLPGGDYNTIFNDLEGINFSAGRLGRLDKNEICRMLLSTFDIPVAERRIFENFLLQALIVNALPFTYSQPKYVKFNKPQFTGPGFDQVDEVKATQAAALRIANKFSNRTEEAAKMGVDFDDNCERLAQEEILLERYGLRMETTAQTPIETEAPETEEEETETTEDTATAAETANIQGTGLNGAQIAGLLAIVTQFTSGAISLDSCNALIAASFPLMSEEEINAITASLTVASNTDEEEDNEEAEGVAGDTLNGNGKHKPKIDKRKRLLIVP